MKMRFLLLILIFGTWLSEPEYVWGRSPHAPTPAEQMTLLFRNGFDHVSGIEQGEKVFSLVEPVDERSTPFDNWSLVSRNPYVGQGATFQYSGGDERKRLARIVPDPVDSANRVLHYRITWPNELMKKNGQYKSRIQTNFYRMMPMKELRISVRFFLPEKEFSIVRTWERELSWLTLFEFWNDPNWGMEDSDPFRVSVNVFKYPGAGQKLTLEVHGQTLKNHVVRNIWKRTSDFELPLGQWITCEVFYREGALSTGRFVLTLTPDGGERQVVFDVRHWTCAPDKRKQLTGLSFCNPMKFYTSADLVNYVREAGGELQIYWDDLAVYGIPRGSEAE